MSRKPAGTRETASRRLLTARQNTRTRHLSTHSPPRPTPPGRSSRQRRAPVRAGRSHRAEHDKEKIAAGAQRPEPIPAGRNVGIVPQGYSDPGDGRVERSRFETEIRKSAHPIREENLFGEAVVEPRGPRNKTVEAVAPIAQLIRNRAAAHDGDGPELGKHRNVTGKIDKTPRRRGMSPVEVDGVTHRPEGVKTDPERQDDLTKYGLSFNTIDP